MKIVIKTSGLSQVGATADITRVTQDEPRQTQTPEDPSSRTGRRGRLWLVPDEPR
jgi:hypothetical protein